METDLKEPKLSSGFWENSPHVFTDLNRLPIVTKFNPTPPTNLIYFNNFWTENTKDS